jgi:8-oxo-dGTP diphosphatase
MKEYHKAWKEYINEAVPFGGLSPTLAGNFGNNAGTVISPHKSNNEVSDEDSHIVVKACLHRNNKVLLLKNERGWDLPGGHLKSGENPTDGLKREVFEETGLNIGDIKMVNPPTGRKRFFCASFLTDDVQLSNEHSEYRFFDISEIKDLEDISKTFKKVILKCLGKETGTKKISNIKVSVKI